MNAETVLRLREHQLRTAPDLEQLDLFALRDDLAADLRALGLAPMTAEQFDNARFAYHEEKTRIAAHRMGGFQ